MGSLMTDVIEAKQKRMAEMENTIQNGES